MKVYVDFTNHVVCSEHDYPLVLPEEKAFQDYFTEDWMRASGMTDEELEPYDGMRLIDTDIDPFEQDAIMNQSFGNYLCEKCECFEVDDGCEYYQE